ncbi:methionine synthase [Clostridium botulinum]|uniref:Vitamin B12 dependent methionine synthase, activation domain protein n=1 Tax=Clostridium botulinum (strain Eklund 17B / Type B) TaxID=935198 RepID=B2TP84_CLOBB|nr:vitamin B12 dependent methionine synthase, activation domain protein [Clostridium botulinum B str. Eklund 17B (NRP)]MBY6975224.1 methionine synthase [Clostridium botulinum]MBY7000773.1 methionine synthase [Clostridium botulinum]MCR1273538.1 methionine synthase [Clostridium botulinum]NFD69691.1 methionine synthase [Clostridium botulinum]
MYNIKQLKIPKDEVLRYLGYKKQELTVSMDVLIDETIDECKKLIIPKYVCAKYKNHTENDGVYVDGTNLILKGEDIKNHLLYAQEVFVIAGTVGSKVEKKIKLYETIELTKALILDACATVAIEEFLDEIEEKIRLDVRKENSAITFRYSPGYGDLSLDIQRDIVNTLKADKAIGLTVSSHYLLFPRKSVTAIIGVIPKEKEEKQRGCEVCKNYNNCSFRREGNNCGA